MTDENEQQPATPLPSDEQVNDAGAREREVAIEIERFGITFKATSLADALAATEYARRIVYGLSAIEDAERATKSGGDDAPVGLHGEGCQCEQIIDRLFGGDIPEGLKLAMAEAKRQRQGRDN